MTDLTEQWKKGELPEGEYYCNTGNTVEILFTWGKNYHQLTNNKDEVYILEMDDCEIIAPVPSYEEWKQLKEYERIVTSYNMKPIDYDIACETVNKLLDERKALKEQNAQLKELLRECRLAIFDYPPYDLASDKIRLTNKIDEALK